MGARFTVQTCTILFASTVQKYSHFVHLSVKCMLARSVRVSVIHRTLTWTTACLTCVREQSCACVYTHGG